MPKWDDAQKLALLKTVLTCIPKPKFEIDDVVTNWLGEEPAPSARSIRDNFNALCRAANDELKLKAEIVKKDVKSETGSTKKIKTEGTKKEEESG